MEEAGEAELVLEFLFEPVEGREEGGLEVEGDPGGGGMDVHETFAVFCGVQNFLEVLFSEFPEN
jgi:hypothetical protein